MIEDLELLALFKVESAEHLANLDNGLLRLEHAPTDQSLLEELFREAHSLKGAARMLGLTKIENITHGLELILSPARKGELKLTPDDLEKMNGIVRQLCQLVQNAITEESTQSSENPVMPESLVIATMPETVAPLPESPSAPLNVPSIAVISETPVISPAASSPTSVELDKNVATPPPDDAFHIETVRVETRKLDDLLTLVSELNVIDGRIQHQLLQMDLLSEQWAKIERRYKTFRSLLRDMRHSAKSEEALSDSGELFLQFSEQFKVARDAFYEDSARLTVTVNTLEEQVHAVRLLPFSTLFALFPRMVRDLAKQQNKEIELVLEGEDIRVDKRILEEMKDPLMHLLRNAIDHGIEPPSEREQKGKTRYGRLVIGAQKENTTILLEVCDDGRGLDLNAIKHIALKRGLYDEATLAAMPSSQLQQLVLLSGFSTSHFITELSGHGIGLDVVRVNVERIKGGVNLESVEGRHLKVQLRLPVSLAATKLLLARVNGQFYGFPVDFIYTSLHLRQTDIFTLEGRSTILLNNQPIITAYLIDLLELKTNAPPSQAPLLACVVIKVADKCFGLLVDELLSVEEIVPKPLSTPLQRVRNVSALAMLGSGEICVVLNPSDLLHSMYKSRSLLLPINEITPAEIRHETVLLVEDSTLIRAMEKRILEDGGYEVITAVDGVEALNLLGTRSFSAVVSDIMMPNMDGLTLTQHIRTEARYKELPVILVTSLASDDDKRRGLELGANAYLPKPSFDQRTLLDTLKRLILT